MGAGENWKRKREAMGKSLGDISGELHISQRYIRDIEEGSFEGWPERVFATGFIRAYAKLLSEDPGPVLTDYYAHVGKVVAAGAPTVPMPRPQWIERERRRGSRMMTYFVAAAAVFVVGMVLAGISWKRAPRIPAAPVVAPLPPPAADNAAPAAADNAAPAAVDNAAPGAAPAAADNTRGAAGTPGAPASVQSVGGTGAARGPYQLFIEASLQTWMRYAVDGGEPVEVMLYPGDRVNIQAQKRITIKLGNAGGVAGTLNGRLLPPFGSSGQVKEFTLGE